MLVMFSEPFYTNKGVESNFDYSINIFHLISKITKTIFLQIAENLQNSE